MPEGPGIKPLFHSVRDIALILDKTVQPGYGVLRAGTVMAEAEYNSKLVPYPQAAANKNDTNAKAYLLAAPSDGGTELYVSIEDSYKLEVGHDLIIDGNTAAVAEVQEIAVTDSDITEADEWVLEFGSVSLDVTAGSTATTVGLSTLLKAHEDYAAAPFVITETANTKLILTWKTAGAITGGLATLTLSGETPIEATQETEGTDAVETGTSAEDLGAIVSIDRTYANSSQAKITVTTGVGTGANFGPTRNGNVYLKGGDESAPFTKAEYILDKDIDTGVGEYAKGAITSVVVSNAILYTNSLIGLDSAAKTDLSTVEDGRFTILK
jgi:hypothetical protein